MSIKIDGITRLRANYYNKIVIRENCSSNNYHVNVSGYKINHQTEVIGKRFSNNFKSKSDIHQVIEIIDDYIDNAKICGVTDLISLSEYRGKKFNIIYGNFGYKKMLLQLYNDNFIDIFSKIWMKYEQDRCDFCYDDREIKSFRIGTSDTCSGYMIMVDELYNGSDEELFKDIKLKEDNYRVIDSERKFIGEFIINICSKFNEKIKIEKVYNNEYEWISDNVIGFMLLCGDIKIYFPRYESLLFINVIVHNYNILLEENKNVCLKKQLKMEGF